MCKAWWGEGGKVIVQANAVLLLSLDRSLVGDVDTIQEFTDILVPDSADTLDRRGGLGDVLDVVALKDKLVLLRLGLADGNAVKHVDVPHELLAQEVSDLDLAAVVLNDAVDREMRIDRAHLVAEALGNTSNHVRDQALNRPQARNMLTPSLPHRERDLIILALDELDVHVHMSDIFRELSARALDADQPRLDLQSDALRDSKLLSGKDVAHFERGLCLRS